MSSDGSIDTPVELFYVNSKITDKENLSPELFTKWYKDIHIPDIFKTSGIKKAYRYVTTAKDIDTIERPYLALYMVLFEGYLSSKEFATIPVTSDVFPGPKHEVFDVADFDARCYRVEKLQNKIQDEYLLTIQYDEQSSVDSLVNSSQTAWTFHCYFSRQNRLAPEESTVGTSPKKLALLWYADEAQLQAAAEQASKIGQAAQFKLLQEFTA